VKALVIVAMLLEFAIETIAGIGIVLLALTMVSIAFGEAQR
jgi:hypothetical protein